MFGLIGAGGDLATELGVTPLKKGRATAAAKWAFERWLAQRGGGEAAEIRQAVEQVRLFIEQYGESRFDPLDVGGHATGQQSRRLADRPGSARQWLIPPENWKSEICQGLDPIVVARTLAERQMLKRAPDGFQCVVKIEVDRAERVYASSLRALSTAASLTKLESELLTWRSGLKGGRVMVVSKSDPSPLLTRLVRLSGPLRKALSDRTSLPPDSLGFARLPLVEITASLSRAPSELPRVTPATWVTFPCSERATGVRRGGQPNNRDKSEIPRLRRLRRLRPYWRIGGVVSVGRAGASPLFRFDLIDELNYNTY